MGVHGVFRTCEWLLSLSLCWFSALSLGVVVSIVRCEREGMSEVEEEEDIRRGGIWEVGVAHDVNPTETERKEGRKEGRESRVKVSTVKSKPPFDPSERRGKGNDKEGLDGRARNGRYPSNKTHCNNLSIYFFV